MITGLFVYSLSAYFFSGSICYLAEISSAKFSLRTLEWQRYQRKLASLWIIMLWPIWIVDEIDENSSIGATESCPETHSIKHVHSRNPKFP